MIRPSMGNRDTKAKMDRVRGQKDIIVEVELEQRHHQLHHLLRVLHKALLQLLGVAHLEEEEKEG